MSNQQTFLLIIVEYYERNDHEFEDMLVGFL